MKELKDFFETILYLFGLKVKNKGNPETCPEIPVEISNLEDKIPDNVSKNDYLYLIDYGFSHEEILDLAKSGSETNIILISNTEKPKPDKKFKPINKTIPLVRTYDGVELVLEIQKVKKAFRFENEIVSKIEINISLKNKTESSIKAFKKKFKYKSKTVFYSSFCKEKTIWKTKNYQDKIDMTKCKNNEAYTRYRNISQSFESSTSNCQQANLKTMLAAACFL